MKNGKEKVPVTNEKAQGIEVQAFPGSLEGRFSNLVMIRHTSEEFVLDFLVQAGEEAYLVSRIWLTPPHFKRLVKAVQNNLSKYEQRFGTVQGLRDKQAQ